MQKSRKFENFFVCVKQFICWVFFLQLSLRGLQKSTDIKGIYNSLSFFMLYRERFLATRIFLPTQMKI